MRTAILFCALIGLLPAVEVGAMDVPGHENRLIVSALHSDGKLSVRIESKNGRSFRLWKDSNSWGAASWRVIVMRQNQISLFYQDPAQMFTRNIPSYAEHPGVATFELDVNQPTWLTTNSKPFSFLSGDIVVALYDVAPSSEAQRFNVWVGVLAAYRIFASDK
jgi:hypothetical protein